MFGGLGITHGAIRENLNYGKLVLDQLELQLARDNFQSWRDQGIFIGPSKLCAPTQSADDMPCPYTNACTEYTRWCFCMLYWKARERHPGLSDQEARFSPTVLSRLLFNHDSIFTATCLGVIRGGETMSDSIFKHDLCKLVIAKMCSTITDDGTGSTKSGKERFKKFANYSGVVGGERLCFNPF
ncbi:hypothetical protein Tco_0431668 [Tanacetum coccineum]